MTTIAPSDPFDGFYEVASWFMGPTAENRDRLKIYFEHAVEEHSRARETYYPEDGPVITADIKAQGRYKKGAVKLDEAFKVIATQLNKYSIPFWSPRYAGHMTFETSMPAITGWLLTILFNPNNVAFEASPLTTKIELAVGKELCAMLGLPLDSSWGHLACDGTVANMESMWVARNLKFYPFSFRAAMRTGKKLEFVADKFMVRTSAKPNEDVLFKNLSNWELLNLAPETLLNLPTSLSEQCNITQDYITDAVNPFSVQEIGKNALMSMFEVKNEPQYLFPATKHYSWPKAAALTGIGASNAIGVPIDNDARMDIDKLKKHLDECLANETPVYAVVGIVGTTEEGAVDPIDRLNGLRDEYRLKGLSFLVHVDAAWGGYFASMIRDPPLTKVPYGKLPDSVPPFPLRPRVESIFKALGNADSITIDPHKAGYIPYPAGGLCYRDGRMRFQITWSAPYLSAGSQESIGVFGIEGSKPGAPAVAAMMHHAVVGLHKNGHGALLGQALWTSARLSAVWETLADRSDPDKTFVLIPLNESNVDPQFIRDHIIGKTNREIYDDKEAREALQKLGSDLNINAFAANFKRPDPESGKVAVLNDDVEDANYLNRAVYYETATVDEMIEIEHFEMFLSSTTFEMKSYGDCCTNFKNRIGLEAKSEQDLVVLRNVVMSPFQTIRGFEDKLGTIFTGIVEQKIKDLLVWRTAVKAQEHAFVLQVESGNSNLYLSFLPNFYDENRRVQLILRAEFEGDPSQIDNALTKARDAKGVLVFFVADTTIAQLVSSTSLSGTIGTVSRHGVSLLVNTDNIPDTFAFTDVRIVKNRSLKSAYRDPKYPKSAPFYLYGTQEAQYIDHVLTRGDNVQITTPCKVSLDLKKALRDDQLAAGVLAFLSGVHEDAAQPPTSTSQQLIRPSQLPVPYSVTIYADAKDPTSHGPGLVDVGSATPITDGKLKFNAWPWVWLGLNVGRDPPKKMKKDTTPQTIRGLLSKSPPLAVSPSPTLAGDAASIDSKDSANTSPWLQLLRSIGMFRDV